MAVKRLLRWLWEARMLVVMALVSLLVVAAFIPGNAPLCFGCGGLQMGPDATAAQQQELADGMVDAVLTGVYASIGVIILGLLVVTTGRMSGLHRKPGRYDDE